MKTPSRFQRPLATAAMLLATVTVSGCQSWTLFQGKCAKPEDFAGVVNNEPLKIPAGRDAPDTRAALTIPNIQGPEAPRPADSPCIDAPPNILPPKPPQA